MNRYFIISGHTCAEEAYSGNLHFISQARRASITA
jgi:hypothetical protein